MDSFGGLEMEMACQFKKPAVILNGVLPWAQAGAKRSEESLTETRAEAVGGNTRAPVPAASAHLESAILHSAIVAKPSWLRSE